MFHTLPFDLLLSNLERLRRAVHDAHGQHLIVNRIDNVVGDFERQPTIWDAYEGRNRAQGWELPADFPTLFEAWITAYRRLAEVRPEDLEALGGAAAVAEAAAEALLAELYRCKDPRAGRLAIALDLFAASEEIVRQNLRRQHPNDPPSLIERYLEEWIHRRPGAESGDGEGRPLSWPRQSS